MIKYNLTCKCGESFESWFLSSSGFDSLCRKKLIKCIFCGSLSVKKSVMAPNLSSKSNKLFKKTKLEKNIKKQLLDVRRYIEKNCRNVGENFTREARSIHYDKKTSQGIYGKATPEEATELLEEGIEVATIPWVDKSEN
jgi:hypothetical protein|tara:strand:- start:101 stop:517 length:417 start_codon:yes stop_codon:yes gene_type:complete